MKLLSTPETWVYCQTKWRLKNKMKQYKYTGLFKSAEGHIYQLEVICNGFLQAFFLLTADAIRSGRHYQLHSIMDENMKEKMVDDIIKCGALLS